MGYGPLPAPGGARRCYLRGQKHSPRAPPPAAADTRCQQQCCIASSTTPALFTARRRGNSLHAFQSRSVHGIISLSFGWVTPAGRPTLERLNRVSELPSTSQLSYSSCADLLIAKDLDGGSSVALFLWVIIKVIITENCSRMEKSICSNQITVNSPDGKIKLFHRNSKPLTLSVKASVLVKVLPYPALSKFDQEEPRDKPITHDRHLFC